MIPLQNDYMTNHYRMIVIGHSMKITAYCISLNSKTGSFPNSDPLDFKPSAVKSFHKQYSLV